MLAHAYQGGNDYTKIKFEGDDILTFENYTGGTRDIAKRTNRVFRDTSAFYHLLFVNAPSAQTIYVNGVQETSWRTNTTGNISTWWNHNISNTMFAAVNGGSDHFDGIVSHVHFCDGTALAPTVFGETDATTGEWKIKTNPTFTLGTNGFTILKDGNTITDQSANSNNFTLGAGTLTKTEDNPSNVFATLNPLDNYYASSTFSNGNTTTSMATSGVETFNASTIGVSSGKYYSEVKVITVSSRTHIGVVNKLSDAIGNYIGQNTYSYAYAGYDGNKWNNGDGGSWGNTYTTNDIIGIAMDLDNNKIYFSKNGAWQNSGDPTSGSTGTGSMYNLTASSSTPAGAYFFAGGKRSNDTVKLSWNFGNGYFGTTAVSSAGTNASGNGIFEYDVPTGYTALSTKGLNL